MYKVYEMNFLKVYKLVQTIPALLFLFAVCWAYPCNAWLIPMHMDITRTAFEQLPSRIQKVFRPYLDEILWASMEPDYFIRDWENHEWNIHRESGDKTAAPTKIEALSREILRDLRQEPADMAGSAKNLGLLFHYLADINQPLNTDDYANDSNWIHLTYEIDAYSHETELHYNPRGRRFRPDIYQAVIDSARQANLYYQAVIDAYAEGDGYDHVRRITQLNYQRAISDIADIWTTLWLQATSDTPSLALQMNQDRFRPGDMIQMTLTVLPGNHPSLKADLYVAVVAPDGSLWFMSSEAGFSTAISPFRKSWAVSSSPGQVIFSAPLPSCNAKADFVAYALLVTPDADPCNPKSWLSNLAEVNFGVDPLPGNLLTGINDEPYLFPSSSDSAKAVGVSLHRWDFIFLGKKNDDPTTPGDETLLNRLIPGNFRHTLLYLGRDSFGRPCGLELIARKSPYLRVVRFPEFEPVYPSGIGLSLPVSIENIQVYRNRRAKRLKNKELEQLRSAEGRVFEQVARDLQTDIPYQMEYSWSGNLADKKVTLVDDGLANGASCTDYLLSLLEKTAGICIHGSRMTAAEVKDYFLFDPSGVLANIPDEWNPFPFPVTIADILNMGYSLEDPPPHRFPCDNTEETGVPLPAKLINSPQLTDIDPVPLPVVYDDWDGMVGIK